MVYIFLKIVIGTRYIANGNFVITLGSQLYLNIVIFVNNSTVFRFNTRRFSLSQNQTFAHSKRASKGGGGMKTELSMRHPQWLDSTKRLSLIHI